jgi:peptide/nickel transport system ATP-binding protein
MPVLEVNDLAIDFDTDQGVVAAIDHLTLSVRENEILGVVGESGCGKTTVARSIMGVVPPPPARLWNGEIRFRGEKSNPHVRNHVDWMTTGCFRLQRRTPPA